MYNIVVVVVVVCHHHHQQAQETKPSGPKIEKGERLQQARSL
jgi:hypothetical protein